MKAAKKKIMLFAHMSQVMFISIDRFKIWLFTMVYILNIDSYLCLTTIKIYKEIKKKKFATDKKKKKIETSGTFDFGCALEF
ncbi:hypothetical protein KUTeg_015827 [Tegillarca granosa]|uniref:Uncharacterized protein n=1 Tax=Tegillarca granosa TaxID=220873 RepID=A0ABQ9EMX4_TEGGR|nr:hypothetical protein KUTeg_015827 [Tegillarca granosa]